MAIDRTKQDYAIRIANLQDALKQLRLSAQSPASSPPPTNPKLGGRVFAVDEDSVVEEPIVEEPIPEEPVSEEPSAEAVSPTLLCTSCQGSGTEEGKG